MLRLLDVVATCLLLLVHHAARVTHSMHNHSLRRRLLLLKAYCLQIRRPAGRRSSCSSSASPTTATSAIASTATTPTPTEDKVF